MEIMFRVMITLTFFILTVPLYIGLFVQAYPEWSKNSGMEQRSSIYAVNAFVTMLPVVQCYYP